MGERKMTTRQRHGGISEAALAKVVVFDVSVRLREDEMAAFVSRPPPTVSFYGKPVL